MWLVPLSVVTLRSHHVVSHISSSFCVPKANMPSCGCSAVCLSAHLLMDFGPFLVWDSHEQKLQCTRVCEPWYGRMLSLLLERLDRTVVHAQYQKPANLSEACAPISCSHRLREQLPVGPHPPGAGRGQSHSQPSQQAGWYLEALIGKPHV